MLFLCLAMYFIPVFIIAFVLRQRYGFKINNPNERWIMNMISQRTFKPIIHSSVNNFLIEVLKNQELKYKDSEYYFDDGNSTLILFVHNNEVSLYHDELSTYVMNTKYISERTLKWIKNAKKKLTTDAANS